MPPRPPSGQSDSIIHPSMNPSSIAQDRGKILSFEAEWRPKADTSLSSAIAFGELYNHESVGQSQQQL